MNLWLLVWVNLELVQLRLLVVIESSVRPHLSFFVALHHQNIPAIVSTTVDSAPENVALTHTSQECGGTHTKKQCNSGKAQTPSKSGDYQTQNAGKATNNYKSFNGIILQPQLKQTGWNIG